MVFIGLFQFIVIVFLLVMVAAPRAPDRLRWAMTTLTFGAFTLFLG